MARVKVGFIGLGVMGKGMAKNLLKAGFDINVFDVVKEPREELQKLGAKVSESAKELSAISNVVIVMVRDDQQTEEVVYGREGVLEGLKKGTLIIMSTVSPGFIQRLETKVKEGLDILDAPVSGGHMGADAGTLSIMVGGKREVFEKCRAVLEAMGKNIFYCGGSGAGLGAKLANNMILEVTIAAVLESLALGSKAGLDLNVLFDIYKTSTAGSWTVDNWDFVTEMRTIKPATLALLRKDVGLALDFAKEKGVAVPLTSFSHTFDLSEKK